MPSKPKPKARDHLLEDPQINIIEKRIQTDQESLGFYGLTFTGLRISEFIHLRRSWLDTKKHLIKIPEAQPCNCKGCIYIRNKLRKQLEFEDTIKARHRKILEGNWLPKTSNSVRTIPIVQKAQDVLYPYFDEHDLLLDEFPLRQYVNTMLTDLGKRSKIRLFPHALRGTFATMLAIKKFTAFEITQTMGWADINTAMFYIKLSGSALLDAFDAKWET